MKNKKTNILFILIILLWLPINCFASTTTYPRTDSNLQIRSSISVTNKVKRAVLATPKVDASEKVYDFANLFTDTQESSLYQLIKNFITTYSMDMVIVTINSNNKSSAMAYADDFYDYNDFGKGTTYDGLLFLIDMDTREMWISTTGQAILMYNDNRIDAILDSSYSYIKSQKYFECAKAFITKSSSFAQQGIPSNNKNYEIDNKGNYKKKSTNLIQDFPLFPAIIISFILSAITVIIARSKHKTIRKATQAKNYIIQNSINITRKEDRFLTSHTTKVYNPPSSSSSSGGSSTHSSSSGSSHGGGGRSF